MRDECSSPVDGGPAMESFGAPTRLVRASRRGVLIALLLSAPSFAQTQPGSQNAGFPSKPVRLIVAVPPGSGADTISRAIGLHLAHRWGRSVVVDNRPGAGGAIALELAVRAPADGYTLLSASMNLVATARLLRKVEFDPRTSYEPVIQTTSQPYVLIASPKAPFATVRELIRYARAHPGVLNYATSGIGSASHLGTELFKSMARVDLKHVPYKGLAQGLNDLAAGQIHLAFSTAVTALTYLKTGRAKALAVTTRRQLALFPGVPTIAESGVDGFELSSSYALYAPASTRAAIVRQINRDVSAVLDAPEVRSRLAADGAEAAERNTPDQFRAAFANEVARWEALINASPASYAQFLDKP